MNIHHMLLAGALALPSFGQGLCLVTTIGPLDPDTAIRFEPCELPKLDASTAKDYVWKKDKSLNLPLWILHHGKRQVAKVYKPEFSDDFFVCENIGGDVYMDSKWKTLQDAKIRALAVAQWNARDSQAVGGGK
jgi:hypothetical protein